MQEENVREENVRALDQPDCSSNGTRYPLAIDTVAAGLAITGLPGVLADAKRVLDELIQSARFWIGPEL